MDLLISLFGSRVTKCQPQSKFNLIIMHSGSFGLNYVVRCDYFTALARLN